MNATQPTSAMAFEEQRQSGWLSARQQQVLSVIRIRHLRGITIREIAEILGICPSNLMGAIYKLNGDSERAKKARAKAAKEAAYPSRERPDGHG